MKVTEELKPNYAPAYAAIYPDLCRILHDHGYALAVHGSMARDFDLVAIPWILSPGSPDKVITAILKTFAMKQKGQPSTRDHGRLVYTLSWSFAECFLDLSFMPCRP